MDADQLSVAARKQKLLDYMEVTLNVESSLYKKLPAHCELVILVQQVAIESWFLGNRRFVPTHPTTELLQEYKAYFDVCLQDPELMAADFRSVNRSKLFGYYTRAQFHASYFHEVFKERQQNRGYNKTKPKEVTEAYYLQELIHRVRETNHLATFQEFLRFCKLLNPALAF